MTTTFTYDANGALVKKEGPLVGTTYYVGPHYEVLKESGGEPVVTKYYFHGGQRVAMDRDGVVQWLIGDHLGTTSLVLDDQGSKIAESRHYPYGEERWRWPQESTFPTEYRFTGQKLVDSAGGIYHMGARFYDPALGRWLSADTLVPDPANTQSFNRYSWVLGNPLKYIDPSGYMEDGECGLDGEQCQGALSPPDWLMYYMYLWVLENYPEWLDYTFEEWGVYNIGFAMRNASVMAREDGVIDDDAYWEWWGTGIMIQSQDPMTQFFIGQQGEYSFHLALMGQITLPSFDAWWGYSPLYWPAEGTFQSFSFGPQPGGTLRPGPYAGESIPARGPGPYVSAAERAELNHIGRTTGCHTCGRTEPGTRSGNFVADHQPPSALNVNNSPQRLYPHCIHCSRVQGGEVRVFLARGGVLPTMR